MPPLAFTLALAAAVLHAFWNTLLARARTGPAGVFAPQGMLAAGFAHQVAWDAIAGCEDPIRAATRAEALAANTGITASGENAVWRGHAKTIIETNKTRCSRGKSKRAIAFSSAAIR